MPHALIPDGFTLKKVTKSEEKAIKDERRHENVTALVNNPEIIKQIIITVSAYLALRESKKAIDELRELGATISEGAENAYTKKRTFGQDVPVGVSIEQLVDEGLNRLFK
jgi:anion-transporting  ArsA/GET3 family ATPase